MASNPYVSRLFHIESGGNPNAVTGSNRGLGQFGPAEERMYGITDANRSDPNAQAAAVQRETDHFTPILTQKLGRAPTPGELYLMHQQGIAGGPALLTADPTAPAWQAIRPFYGSDAIAQKAIGGNIPRGSPLYGADPANITAGDFSKYWVNKFENGDGGYAQFAQGPLTPGSEAPALPPGINIGAQPQTASAQPAPSLLGGIFGGAAQTGQQPQQNSLAGLLGGLGNATAAQATASDQPPPMQMAQAFRPQINMQPLLQFLQARQQSAPQGWSV